MYKKPGVEVTQVIRTNTPILQAPALESTLVGVGYKWNDFHTVGSHYTNTLHDLTELNGEPVADTILVKVRSSASDDSKYVPFTYNSETKVISLAAGLNGEDTSPHQVLVAYLARLSANRVDQVLVADAEYQNIFGTPVPWNPLGYSVHIALGNSGGGSVNFLAVDNEAVCFEPETLAELTASQTYAAFFQAPATSGNFAEISSWAETQSQPENKREVAAFGNLKINPGLSKADYISTITNVSAGLLSKRTVVTFAEGGYVEATVPTGTLTDAFRTAVFGVGNAPRAKFATPVVSGGVTYTAGEEITDEIVTNLKDNGKLELNVLYGVPGYYQNAMVAGQLARPALTTISAPLSNAPLKGVTKLYRQHRLDESDLNQIAAAGTWIFAQNSPNASIYTRHQLTTQNLSTVEREFSVTRSIDFAAKLMRDSLTPYVGRFVINDNFLDLVFSVLSSAGFFLSRNNIVRDVKISNVEQDTTNPDTINVEVQILPLFPANYIKIKLVI